MDLKEMVILNKGIKYLLILLITACTRNNTIENNFYKKSLAINEYSRYKTVLKLAQDSISFWKKKNVPTYEVGKNGDYVLDTLLCFDSEGKRFVSCLLCKTIGLKSPTGSINFFYGEKIHNDWYFFQGASVFIPTELKSNHSNEDFNYDELHNMAINEIYTGYLNNNGDINENWFKYHFDDPMMNYRKYTSKEEYNKLLIAQCKGIWADRYRPYKTEDFNFIYNKKNKIVDFSFNVQTYDSVYNYPRLYKVIYEYPGLGYLEGACGSYWCDEMNWFKNKTAKVQLKNIPENTEVKIYLEFIYFPDVRSERMGPFVFSTSEKKEHNQFVID